MIFCRVHRTFQYLKFTSNSYKQLYRYVHSAKHGCDMSKYKLYYFDERGRAEISRLLFAAAGVEYEDIRYTKQEWFQKYKQMMPTGRCPLLEVDGYKISQSLTIARYLANVFDMAGKSHLERAQVDEVVDEMDDLLTKYYDFYFRCAEGAKVTERKRLVSEEFPRLMGVILKWQEEAGDDKGFIVGSSLTMADLELYECCTTYLVEEPKILNSFPKIQAHRKLVEAQPGISDYLKTRPFQPV